MKNVFIILLSGWIILAFFNIFYNFTKTYFELKEWASLSDTNKRVKIFGEYYLFVEKLNKITSDDSKTLFVYSNGRDFFLARYFLYPKRIDMLWEHSNTTKSDIYKFDYIVSQNSNQKLNSYLLIECFYSSKLIDKWCIYKKL